MGECLPVHTDAELQLAIFNQFKTEGISTYLLLALFVMIVVGFTLLYPQSILGDDLYLFTSVLFVSGDFETNPCVYSCSAYD